MKVKCLKGTREKFILKRGEMYIAEKTDSKWLVVQCEDGIERNFLMSRFSIINPKD